MSQAAALPHLIDGKAAAARVLAEVSAEVEQLKHLGIQPGLAVVLPTALACSAHQAAQVVRRGQMLFDPKRHDFGAKVVLGHTLIDMAVFV